MKKVQLNNLILLIAIFSSTIIVAQNEKLDNFHKIPEVMAFDAGMKMAKPIMRSTLEESMFTDQNKEMFGGKKGIKNVIDQFMGKYEPLYISNKYFEDKIDANFSANEIKCLAELNCKDSAIDDKWKSEYAVFEQETTKYAEEYGKKIMMEVISEVVK